MLECRIYACDGTFDEKYNDIEEFVEKRTKGKWECSHEIVSDDGVNRIVPLNDETYRAMEEYRIMNSIEVPFMHEMDVFNAVGLDESMYKRLIVASQSFNPEVTLPYVDTDIGRIFPIRDRDELQKFIPSQSALKDIGLTKGSLAFADTVVVNVVKGEGSLSFVIDERKEALIADEVTARAIEKVIVLETHDSYDPDMGIEYTVVFDVTVFGNNELVKNAYDSFEQQESNFRYEQGGFSNSEANPVENYHMDKVLRQGESINLYKKGEEPNNHEHFEGMTKVTSKMLSAAGATGNTLYFKDKDDSVISATKGQMLKQEKEMFHSSSSEIKVHNPSNVAKEFTVITDEEAREIDFPF